MRPPNFARSFINICVGAALVSAVDCSSGGAAVDGSAEVPDLSTGPGPRPEFDLSAPPVDAAAPPADMAITVVKSCSWRERFEQVYGHAWSGADVAFVTLD